MDDQDPTLPSGNPPVIDPPIPPLNTDQPAEPAPDTSSYFEKLLLLVPSDMIAGYLALDGILKSLPEISLSIYWAVFSSMLVLTPLYIWFKPAENSILRCSRKFRLITGTISFAVWVFALGGPFSATFESYQPVYGSLLLVITTLTIPVFEKIADRFKF
ncbi:MAG: hypothetical protein SGJ27_04915 [Candidatus Melainabacteria bacterium]|nr:hypothetical protein [Candidatus Melainabacteria bacterium]